MEQPPVPPPRRQGVGNGYQSNPLAAGSSATCPMRLSRCCYSVCLSLQSCRSLDVPIACTLSCRWMG
eukprot:COSAG02_NODE_2975_length_7633_cov_3.190072_6_plen_67_part_00